MDWIEDFEESLSLHRGASVTDAEDTDDDEWDAYGGAGSQFSWSESEDEGRFGALDDDDFLSMPVEAFMSQRVLANSSHVDVRSEASPGEVRQVSLASFETLIDETREKLGIARPLFIVREDESVFDETAFDDMVFPPEELLVREMDPRAGSPSLGMASQTATWTDVAPMQSGVQFSMTTPYFASDTEDDSDGRLVDDDDEDDRLVEEYLRENPDLRDYRDYIDPAIARRAGLNNVFVVFPPMFLPHHLDEDTAPLSDYELVRRGNKHNNLENFGDLPNNGDMRFLDAKWWDITSILDQEAIAQARRLKAELAAQRKAERAEAAQLAREVKRAEKEAQKRVRESAKEAERRAKEQEAQERRDEAQARKEELERMKEENRRAREEEKRRRAEETARVRAENASRVRDSLPPPEPRPTTGKTTREMIDPMLIRYTDIMRRELSGLPWGSEGCKRVDGVLINERKTEAEGKAIYVRVADLPATVHTSLESIMNSLERKNGQGYMNVTQRQSKTEPKQIYELLRAVKVGEKDGVTFGTVKNVYLGKTVSADMAALLNAATMVDPTLRFNESLYCWVQWLLRDDGDENAETWLRRVQDGLTTTEVKPSRGGGKGRPSAAKRKREGEAESSAQARVDEAFVQGVMDPAISSSYLTPEQVVLLAKEAQRDAEREKQLSVARSLRDQGVTPRQLLGAGFAHEQLTVYSDDELQLDGFTTADIAQFRLL